MQHVQIRNTMETEGAVPLKERRACLFVYTVDFLAVENWVLKCCCNTQKQDQQKQCLHSYQHSNFRSTDQNLTALVKTKAKSIKTDNL